ncbi:hypothetical protein EST38_g12031 [Candolleomyces aberdarensis]|uniref:Nephrocystin 3-like N-terminal domain-containing protein n=1 Tax=Candolleomyces aberdarensis TaxID=2316362 RepID=A0A4Q2D3H1_9AGAR|nr:hypothetical protein EST38_g12031 [Candolleomyces aberdarensis]
MWAALEAANKEKSTGVIAYVLAEDDVQVLKKANKSLDELLHGFWIENHIAGTIVLADILSTVQDQARHSERVPGAAYDSQEVAAKIMPCFEGTRSTLLANVGRWMSGAVDGHNPPLYILDGIAGIGKSTVAITVAQRAADPEINCLGATFFFSRDQEDRKRSLGFVHTIAYQLACYHASYGKAIAAAITSNPAALDKVLTQQFNLLVAKPLQPAEEDKAKLAQLSGKLFIYASTAVKFILDQQHLDPKGQLESLLELQPDSSSPLSQLDGLYFYVLHSAKPVKNAENWLRPFQIIVGAILVLQTPLSVMSLARLLDQQEGTIKATLGNLHSILAPSGEGSALTYKVHHKSFPDFITGPSCPSEFQIIEEEHHLDLAKCCLQVMSRQLKFNICQVPVPSVDQFKDLDDLLKEGLSTEHITQELQYALCYWASHLSKAKGMDSDLMALLDQFSKEHLMHWLEGLAWIKQLDVAHSALEEALATLASHIGKHLCIYIGLAYLWHQSRQSSGKYIRRQIMEFTSTKEI